MLKKWNILEKLGQNYQFLHKSLKKNKKTCENVCQAEDFVLHNIFISRGTFFISRLKRRKSIKTIFIRYKIDQISLPVESKPGWETKWDDMLNKYGIFQENQVKMANFFINRKKIRRHVKMCHAEDFVQRNVFHFARKILETCLGSRALNPHPFTVAAR